MSVGKVWLVGAGPGEPGLLTLRGRDVLAQADVVLHDALSHPGLLDLCRAGAELRDVGKRGGSKSPSQAWIIDQLVELAGRGLSVVRLKGGDPLLFARGGEEAIALAGAKIPFEIVPGIASPGAVAAYAGIPLTHRGVSSSVTFITGSDRAGVEWSAEAWRKLATATDTICVLMGMARLAPITRALVEGGRAPSTPAAIVQWGARPEQRVIVETLETIAARAVEAGFANPAILIVGEVVSLRESMRWYDKKPLFGRRVLVPRVAERGRDMAQALLDRGADPVLFPVIEIVDPPDPGALALAVLGAASYRWVLFTSANAVERVFREVTAARRDARILGDARVGAIGPGTAALLRKRGIEPDVVAEDAIGEGLAKAVLAEGAPGRVLLPRALVARNELPEMLTAAGGEVDIVAAYETKRIDGARAAELARLFEEGRIDVVLLTSSSIAEAVADALGERATRLLSNVFVASIGPITTASAVARGLRVDVTATEHTISGLLDAIERAGV